MNQEHRATFRVPEDVQRFLAQEARANCTSRNAEVVRSVRERMVRQAKPTTGESLQATAPAAGHHDTALQGGPEIHGL